MGIDTRTPMGKAMEHMAVVFAELERDDVVARVVQERTEGKTAHAIARDLSKDAVPTAQGARAWSQASVRALLMREGVH